MSSVIAEFRANEGRVGGGFEGAPMILVHHVGRKSGKEYVNPLVYLPGTATTTRSTSSPPRAARRKTLSGTATSSRRARPLSRWGPAPTRSPSPRSAATNGTAIYAEQVKRMPGFGEYAEKTEGIRKIPVLRLNAAG